MKVCEFSDPQVYLAFAIRIAFFCFYRSGLDRMDERNTCPVSARKKCNLLASGHDGIQQDCPQIISSAVSVLSA